MGKYAYKEKKLKALKRGAFYPLMAINCMVVGLIALFIMLGVMSTLQVNSESLDPEPIMLKPIPIILVGLGIFVLFGVIERLCRLRWDMKWFDFVIAGYVIPIVIWGVLALIALTNWWSNRNSDDAIVLKWLTLVMLIYLSVGIGYRIICHFVSMIIDKLAMPGRVKRSEKKNKKEKEND